MYAWTERHCTVALTPGDNAFKILATVWFAMKLTAIKLFIFIKKNLPLIKISYTNQGEQILKHPSIQILI